MPTLPCADGGGSLNNPNGSPAQTGANNSALQPYVPPNLCVGELSYVSTNPSACQQNDQLRQEAYVAEALNLTGAPINVFKLLGVHEQGPGDITSSARLIASAAYPAYPITGVNSGTVPWRSLQQGINVVGSGAYVGLDFGIKRLATGQTEYEPPKQKWTKVGAILITQANTPTQFAKQVKVEIADGTCEVSPPAFTGVGDGGLAVTGLGPDVTQCVVTIVALTTTTFNIYATLPDGSTVGLGTATVGLQFNSLFVNFIINAGLTPYAGGDMFSIAINYVWKRVGIYNLVQSPLPQALNFQTALNVKALRVIPTLFTGSDSWEVSALTASSSPQTNVNNIQDLFFNENRDRDYAKEPILLKVQYQPADSTSDLAKFGINILDQYSFTTSWASMVSLLGRPIVVGDVIEVIPEMQWDQNLLPIRKFVEVTDTGWASEGFSTQWRPTVYRFTAQPAIPSQETRDIFGTLDTQKYLIPDQILSDGIGEQLDITPLISTEEIMKAAADAVPETGSDDQRVTQGAVVKSPAAPANLYGQPPASPSVDSAHKQNIYIEDGLPKNGEPYGEGYKLPDPTTVSDGDYFRLNYPVELKLPARLYRYSALKHRWLYVETDRRGDYSSHKPTIRNILQSDTKQGLGKKTT